MTLKAELSLGKILNWLFSGNSDGARAMCFFFSLIEAAKVNKLEPYSYLTKVFTLAPLIKEDGI